MELTVKQAIYSLLVPLCLYEKPRLGYRTTKAIVEGLKTGYNIEITKEHTGRLIREIALECGLIECEKDHRRLYDIYLSRERLFMVKDPGEILTVKKWKRDGHRGKEISRKPKGDANPV
ncbi:hypothetical protein ES703_23748 [subsurface metagenome]